MIEKEEYQGILIISITKTHDSSPYCLLDEIK